MNQITTLTGGSLVLPNGIRNADLRMAQGRIVELGEALPAAQDEARIDVRGLFVMPGMIDVHTHGGGGVDANQADAQALTKLSRFFAAQGVTGYLPTVLSDTPDATECAVRTIAAARKNDEGARVLGIHLEGPHLCAAYKGAMPESLLTSADSALLRRYLRAAEGAVLRMTVSPEVSGVPELIAEFSAQGVGFSLGHSGADYETAMRCIAAGANCATHTMNAMRLLHQHEPAVLGAVLESDCYAEMICDGLHLHPGIVRLLIKAKGLDRAVAITDSIMAAGLGDGAYKLGVQDIIVRDGDARLADGSSRAGSVLTMIGALRNLLRFTGLPLHQASYLVSRNPAALLGLSGRKGSLAPGMDADILLLTPEHQVVATLVAQKPVYRAEGFAWAT